MKPTFGSLFAGIGGIDLGLERAGWECRWQVENDGFCTKVLEKRWPDVTRYGDCRSIDPYELEAVNLVCGGFPCQSVSTAGKRKGENDPRWLWPEFRRFVRILRPKWVLAENVPGLLSIDSGRLFGGILRELAEGGYDAEWDCVPAAAFGAPHLRYRVFIVAHSRRLRLSQTEQTRNDLGQGEGADALRARIEGCREAISRRAAPADEAAGRTTAYSNGERCKDAQERRAMVSIFGGGNPPPWGTWPVEPTVGRVANGVSDRVDRLKSLGNAVVPQVAEWIGKGILRANSNQLPTKW